MPIHIQGGSKGVKSYPNITNSGVAVHSNTICNLMNEQMITAEIGATNSGTTYQWNDGWLKIGNFLIGFTNSTAGVFVVRKSTTFTSADKVNLYQTDTASPKNVILHIKSDRILWHCVELNVCGTFIKTSGINYSIVEFGGSIATQAGQSTIKNVKMYTL